MSRQKKSKIRKKLTFQAGIVSRDIMSCVPKLNKSKHAVATNMDDADIMTVTVTWTSTINV